MLKFKIIFCLIFLVKISSSQVQIFPQDTFHSQNLEIFYFLQYDKNFNYLDSSIIQIDDKIYKIDDYHHEIEFDTVVMPYVLLWSAGGTGLINIYIFDLKNKKSKEINAVYKINYKKRLIFATDSVYRFKGLAIKENKVTVDVLMNGFTRIK